jgi:hypothetical protein
VVPHYRPEKLSKMRGLRAAFLFPVTTEYCQEMGARSHYDALFWLQKQRFIPLHTACE